MSVNPKGHQTIDIIVVDIPKNYGICLSRYWSAMLNGYFDTDWSHLWLPYNGKMNQIRVDRERYMKHFFTNLNDPNEPVMYNNLILGNYSYETFFGNFIAETSSLAESNTRT